MYQAGLLDMKSYQSMKDAINMLRLLRLSERDVAAGNCRPAEKVFANLKSKYGINDWDKSSLSRYYDEFWQILF